jgi:hypothetical protein
VQASGAESAADEAVVTLERNAATPAAVTSHADAADAAEAAEEAEGKGDVMVITWPDGTIHRMPRGSTVRDLCARGATLEAASVCVNNHMVRACATRLRWEQQRQCVKAKGGNCLHVDCSGGRFSINPASIRRPSDAKSRESEPRGLARGGRNGF